MIFCLIFYLATLFTKGLPLQIISIVLALLFVLYALNALGVLGSHPLLR